MEEIRLNKLLSDAGLCSRRDADRFIEAGRVNVNGKPAEVGQKVTASDIVMLDDVRVDFKDAQEYSHKSMSKTRSLIFGSKDAVKEKRTKPAGKKKSSSGKLRPGKYVKYNKYAAARKAAKRDEDSSTEKGSRRDDRG